MNDVSPPGLDDVDPAAAAQPAPGFGAALARAREALGISVGDIATRLRLHPRQIIALEEERLDALPELTFVRGFLRNYAKEVQLDPAPLLAALNARTPAAAAVGETIAGTGVAAAEVRRAGVERASRLGVIGGSVAMLVVLGAIGWVASQRKAAPPVEAGAPATAAPVARPETQPEAAAATPAQATSADAAAEPKGGSLPAPAAAPGDAAAAATPTPGAAPAAATTTSPTPPAAAGGGLRLVVGDRPSWVEITQADGRVVLTGLLDAGAERRIANLQPPLQLVIGNASSVTLEYRGKAVDLQRHARANDLARLTLE
jgi:cytoskeleton protein RodZ